MSLFRQIFSISVFSIIFARVWYAINWFNIPAIFYLIVIDFEQDISMLGLITTSFLLGIGIFQVVVGIIAIRYDLRFILIMGTIILSLSALLSGVIFETYQMMILRFLVGVGMAFFFGPSVILISKYLGKGSGGLGIGLLNSAHSFGGIIGIFMWIIIAESIGWRSSLFISGGTGLASGIFLFYTLYKRRHYNTVSENINKPSTTDNSINHIIEQNQKIPSQDKINLTNVKSILINRSIIIIGLSLLGIQIGWTLVFTFTVFFLKDYLFFDPSLSGLIVALPMLLNTIFAPIFGKIYDMTTQRNSYREVKFFVVLGILLAGNISLFSISNIYLIIVSIVIIGIVTSGGFVIPYSMARKIAVVKLNQPQYETLVVSFVNGISLLGVFWVPLLFSYLVQGYGYSIAWMTGSLLTMVFILPIIKLKI